LWSTASPLINSVKAPAGLELGAITPEEIALSILAEVTTVRRRGQHHSAPSETARDVMDINGQERISASVDVVLCELNDPEI
jgi:hypothetical protein